MSGRKKFDRFQEEWKTDRVLRQVAEGKRISELLRKAVTILAPGVRTEDLDAVMAHIFQEIMKGKLDGIPVSEQLPSVDRLLAREKLAQKADEVKLKEQKLELEERRQKALEKRMEEAGKESVPAKAVTEEDWEEMERKLRLL
jgi:hypothetical protein